MNDEPTHKIAIVEDDPPTAAQLARYVESMGFEALVATSFEEATTLLEAGGFCLALLDMELPRRKGDPADVVHGYALLEAFRASDRRRNARDRHVLQILVVTGYSKEPVFVERVLEAHGNGFIEKPFKAETVVDKIKKALASAGRDDHAECVALEHDRAATSGSTPSSLASRGEATEVVPEGAPRAVLTIAAEVYGKTNLVDVNGAKVELQDEQLLLLLKLVDRHRVAPGKAMERKDLGIGTRSYTTGRLNRRVAHALPEGFLLVISNRRGQCLLNPLTVVKRADWAGLALHGHEGIAKLARDVKARGSTRRATVG